MSTLYELVKESKNDTKAIEKIIDMFEPKIKKSLHLTKPQEKEDLAQELKCKIVSCILKYDIASTPGFWEMKEILKDKKTS